MKTIRLAFLLIAGGTALLATTINFDDQATAASGISGILLTNQYAAQGVLFNSIDASQSFKNNITPASSPNYATPFFGTTNPGFIIFVSPLDSTVNAWVDSASFTLLGLTSTVAHPGNFAGATIDALDLTGSVIAGQSQVIPATSTSTSNQVLTFTGQVHEIRFTLTPSTTGILPFDDLIFGAVTAAPEPSTCLTIGA